MMMMIIMMIMIFSSWMTVRRFGLSVSLTLSFILRSFASVSNNFYLMQVKLWLNCGAEMICLWLWQWEKRDKRGDAKQCRVSRKKSQKWRQVFPRLFFQKC